MSFVTPAAGGVTPVTRWSSRKIWHATEFRVLQNSFWCKRKDEDEDKRRSAKTKKDLKGSNAPFEGGPRPNTFWKSDSRPKEKAYPTEKKAHENLSS